MTETAYNQLVIKNREHKVFNSDWEIYYSIDFADTLLPEIPLYRGKGLWMFDGAELFIGLQKTASRVLDIEGNGTLINLIAYTYPKDVKAAERKQFVQAAKSEVCLFVEVAQDDSIELSFKLGKRFKDYLQSLASEGVKVPTPAAIESQTYPTTIADFKAFFGNQLVHEDLMRFVFSTLGIEDFHLEESFDFDLPEVDVSIFEEEPEQKDDSLIEKLNTFSYSLNKGSIRNFDCVAKFFRSKEQMEGKFGINDTSYTGSFGFQHYDESTDGDGRLSLKYFPDFVIDMDNDNYKIPFLSLWSPKSRIITSNTIPVTKAVLWCRFDVGADNFYDSGAIYFDTGTPNVRINGSQKGTLYKDENESPFTFGDVVSFDVTCVNTLTDYAFAVFRETDSSGKVIGILTIVPNKNVYKTEVNLVDVTLGYQNRFIGGEKINHPLRQSLLKHFNENSFNQSHIYVDIYTGYETLEVNRNLLPKIETDSNGKPFITRSNRDIFHKAIKTAYDDAMVEKSGDITQNLLTEIRNYISSIEKFNNAFARKKQRLKRTALQLINLIIKKFKQYSKQDYAYTRTFEDPEVMNAIALYTEERDAYRKELFEAVDNRYKNNIHYKSLDKHKIKEAIMLGNDVTTLGNSAASINPFHQVYIFLYKDIHSFKDSADTLDEVAGFATNGDGFCHIFNLTLTHKTQCDELIAHEVGHAFGLKHTFDYTKEEIDEEYQKKLKEIEDERKANEGNNNSTKGHNTDTLKAYFNRAERNLKNKNNYEEIDKIIYKKNIEKYKLQDKDKSDITKTADSETEYLNRKTILDEKYKHDLEMILNLKQAQTQENYLDYDIPKRKSFWYWQWKEMQKNVKLLEEIKLNKYRYEFR